MTVLVTGGAGYIGSHVVLALRDAGMEVAVLDDLSTGSIDAIPDGVAFAQGSTGDQALLERVIRANRVTAVMHFAASLVVPDSLRDPLGYWRNNVANTATLAACAAAAGVRDLVFSSTAAVYGGSPSGLVDEDSATIPINPYGNSKLAAERMLRDAAAAHGLRLAILRYFNVAGADPSGRSGQRTPEATHLVKVACEAALGRRDGMDLYGTDYETPDGTCVRDFIHVSDLADAHLLALGHLRRGGDGLTLDCGYGEGHSVRDVIATVERLCGRRIPVRARPRRAGDAASLVARAERIRRVLGWEPRLRSLDTIVGSALRWEEEQGGFRRRVPPAPARSALRV